jgi:hypothetical protein
VFFLLLKDQHNIHFPFCILAQKGNCGKKNDGGTWESNPGEL